MVPWGVLRLPGAPKSYLVQFWIHSGLHLGPQGTPKGTQKSTQNIIFSKTVAQGINFLNVPSPLIFLSLFQSIFQWILEVPTLRIYRYLRCFLRFSIFLASYENDLRWDPKMIPKSMKNRSEIIKKRWNGHPKWFLGVLYFQVEIFFKKWQKTGPERGPWRLNLT